MQKKESLDDYELIEKLGQGAYGEVMLAKQKENKQLYAIKILDKRMLMKEKKQYQVFIEKEVLQRIKHPGLINLFSSFQNAEHIYLILELVEGGDFSNFLKMNKNLSVDTIAFYTAQIVSTLEILHSNGIAHRDVKPENIMVTNEMHIKMIDFGTASFFDMALLPQEVQVKLAEMRELSKQDDRFTDEIEEYQQKHKSTFVGTAEYVSPELLEDDMCGPPADLWALGCIIYKMFTSVTPFTDANEYKVFQKVKECQYDKSDKIPPLAMNLIEKLLQRDPMSRLGAGIKGPKNSYADLKAHPFFNEINWDELWTQRDTQRLKLHQYLRKSNSQTQISKVDNNEIRRAKSLIRSDVLLSGLVNKKTGWMIYKPRNMILYDYEVPKLEYFDPNTGQKKGQIFLDKTIKIEILKGQFNIDVPNKKKYYFKECEHPANIWVEKIKEVMDRRELMK